MGKFFKKSSEEELFDDYERRDIKSPKDEIHLNSEPGSAKHADKNGVYNKLGAGIFVVSKNVVNVMTEKSGYGHVEPVEKIRNGRALERKIKVLGKVQPKASAKASCHIAKA